MKGKIDIQIIPVERLLDGNPAYIYEEGYFFNNIQSKIKNENGEIELVFDNGDHIFPASKAYEFIIVCENKNYPLIPSQWLECLDNDWYGTEKILEFTIVNDIFAKIEVESINIGNTGRGFAIGEFKDCYGKNCSIQMSSSASRRCIWLGINDAEPKIMASQAHKFGVHTNETTGWVKYPIPDEVSLNTRMHLTREDVKRLLPLLIKFAETGDL